ncbi:MAG: chromosome segregation protein SMC [bacterium]
MYVSRIEMIGFKSFAEKTVVDLESGITAVVGPNGCGKTNICDAIRWVLGEENVRLLRGTRAEDVIFAGTDLRKSLGFAEVSLTVSDVRDSLPVEYTDVTVTRRAFRSGDSEFLINNVPVRLKDIVDLFLGTGFGRRAYSVMERDMVDWILDDTGGQRRRIIEEAAGISKYKARRKETQNKLELTERDLERVQDLISEVERRVRQLARQAARARRYERLTERITQVETYASAKEYGDMRARQAEARGRLEAIDIVVAEQAGRMALAEAQIETARLAAAEVENDLTARGKTIAETTQATQKLEAEKSVLAERARALDEKIAETARARAEKLGLAEEKRKLVEAKGRDGEEARSRLVSLCGAYRDLQAEYRRLDDDLRARREESVASARRRLEDVKHTIDVASSLTEARARKRHLTETSDKSQSKHQWITNRIGELRGEIERTEGEIGRLTADLAGEGARLDELSGVITEVTAKIELIRAELQRLAEEDARESSRHDVFKEIVERYEGYETGVRALMQDRRKGSGVHGVVGDILRCTEPRFEPALATALHNSLQYVVVDGKDHAIDSVRLLKEEKKGPATLLVLDGLPGERSASAAPQAGAGGPGGEGVIGRMSDYVDCDPRYRGVVEYLLRDVFIVDTLDRAFSLSRQATNGSHDFVTPEGDAVLRGSIVRAGQNGASADALLGRRRKLDELAGRVEALRSLTAEQSKSYEELKRSLEALETECQSRRRGFEEARRPLSDLEKVLESKRLERDSLERAAAELDSEIAGARQAIEAASADIERLSREHGALPAGRQGALFDEKVETHDQLEREVGELQKRLEETNAEMLRLEAGAEFIDQTAARLKGEAEDLERDLAALAGRESELAAAKVRIGEDHDRLVKEVHGLLDVLADLESQRNKVIEKKRELDAGMEDARRRVKAVMAEREQQLAAKQGLQAEINLADVKCDAVARRLAEEFEVDIASVDFQALEPVENCEEELAKLRSHLRDLGPVNLVALEEFETEKQRYDFLKAQRDDLTKARQSLDEAILQINRRARSEFVDIFEQVRRDFRKNFQTLFQGGDADLRLADENDPLESPVEILAQPSGKKLEHIGLLSGGERALTALAFLFAVYYTKPSPFCLLDEVDAPLDDANVGRFINLMKDFSSKTQFLMVTHNKKTMESASCLYGVTMQEPGISRIVSVKMERGKEAAPDASPDASAN